MPRPTSGTGGWRRRFWRAGLLVGGGGRAARARRGDGSLVPRRQKAAGCLIVREVVAPPRPTFRDQAPREQLGWLNRTTQRPRPASGRARPPTRVEAKSDDDAAGRRRSGTGGWRRRSAPFLVGRRTCGGRGRSDAAELPGRGGNGSGRLGGSGPAPPMVHAAARAREPAPAPPLALRSRR